MPTTTLDIEHEFRGILAPDSVRAASSADAVCGIQPRLVLEPVNEQQLAAVLRLANDAGLAVIPRGGGTKLSWGNPSTRADIILSTARLHKIIEHAWADLTVSVEAGCTIQKLQSALVQHGQRLALDPLWPAQATIGGVLSTNDSGSLRLRFGALRDLIIGVTLGLPDGTLASSGGKVVKNVAGYDLPKLATGAFGTLGVITRAVFRLHPLPRFAKTISFSAENFATMQDYSLAIQDSKLAHTALQLCCSRGTVPRADILFEATEAGINEQELHLRKILGCAWFAQATENVWNARQDLWNSTGNRVISKISVLPAELAKTTETLAEIASVHSLGWQMVAQGTGIAVLRFDGQPALLSAAVKQLRASLEAGGSSLVVLLGPGEPEQLESWGRPGDAWPLMRAVKHQLDPKGILNPGRFVGGI